jgi:hypothetical protein
MQAAREWTEMSLGAGLLSLVLLFGFADVMRRKLVRATRAHETSSA